MQLESECNNLPCCPVHIICSHESDSNPVVYTVFERRDNFWVGRASLVFFVVRRSMLIRIRGGPGRASLLALAIRLLLIFERILGCLGEPRSQAHRLLL